jgi:hypothetical protein
MMAEEPGKIEKNQDKRYTKLRKEGMDSQEAANIAAPPETTKARVEESEEQ